MTPYKHRSCSRNRIAGCAAVFAALMVCIGVGMLFVAKARLFGVLFSACSVWAFTSIVHGIVRPLTSYDAGIDPLIEKLEKEKR